MTPTAKALGKPVKILRLIIQSEEFAILITCNWNVFVSAAVSECSNPVQELLDKELWRLSFLIETAGEFRWMKYNYRGRMSRSPCWNLARAWQINTSDLMKTLMGLLIITNDCSCLSGRWLQALPWHPALAGGDSFVPNHRCECHPQKPSSPVLQPWQTVCVRKILSQADPI